MSAIVLTGLVGSHPLGALAAFGLLRCCAEFSEFRGSRLGWRNEPDWVAVLETPQPATNDQLIAALVARQRDRPTSPELNWADNIKTDRERYCQAAREAGVSLEEGRRTFADFLAAFACELSADDNGKLEPTAFYMTSGRQEFLKEARSLAKRLAGGVSMGRRTKDCAAMFREALLGPWKYEDPQHSLGWDPATERLHALRAKSPTKESSEGVAAAVWLAFEALPLFPCFLSSGRLETTGFQTRGSSWRERVTHLTWPIWSHPVSLDTVRTLLGLAELAQEKPPAKWLRARGITAVFRAERFKVKTQGAYYILRQGVPCC